MTAAAAALSFLLFSEFHVWPSPSQAAPTLAAAAAAAALTVVVMVATAATARTAVGIPCTCVRVMRMALPGAGSATQDCASPPVRRCDLQSPSHQAAAGASETGCWSSQLQLRQSGECTGQ
jgi:hypothetical protein